ncbi:calcium-binding protein [Salipiger sp. HF18]|uniref:calcium-binding protein n=1 Tax=Salipiger sp. HF18 TaxID=2721557 RepID=UPI00142E2E3C|nr:calcium-binding protein [Salipiger sp. HF18]NIY97932.1 calcium-binding protein [Salipiger sp. HF18]
MFMMIGLLCVGGVALALSMPIEEVTEDNDAAGAPDAVDDDEDDVSSAECAEPDADAAILSGTEGDDTLEGGVDDDFIVGGAGNDELLGGAGADVLIGGAANDVAVGDDGDDTLIGGDEAEDYLIGAAGDDVLITGQRDHAYGGGGEGAFVLLASGGADEAAYLVEFNPDDDVVVVVLVSSDQADAEVTLGPSESDPDQTELRIDGEVVATIATADAPGPEDIQLLISSALLQNSAGEGFTSGLHAVRRAA